VESDYRQANIRCSQLQNDIETLRSEREQLTHLLNEKDHILQVKDHQIRELTASQSAPSLSLRMCNDVLSFLYSYTHTLVLFYFSYVMLLCRCRKF
jgi:hypothetical protein